jgi:uncharacterized protein YecE (DUF72 family)
MTRQRSYNDPVELYLGTGGYSNDDWQGLIYPAGTKSSQYLNLYATHFNAVELNSSFYAIPGIRAFEGMVKKSGGRVRFAIKVHRSITHERDADGEMYQRLFESVAPLREVGMLGPFLAQFPYSFHRTRENRRYLKGVVDRFAVAGEMLAVEFRHGSWESDEVLGSLKDFGVIAVSVDYPPLRGLPGPGLRVTGPVAYARLHGRNRAKWWDGKSAAERHDYRYESDELRPWAEWIAERERELEQVYLIMQNTTRGHALFNLVMLRELFGELGIEANVNLEL